MDNWRINQKFMATLKIQISGSIAQELRRRCDLQLRDVPSVIQEFVESYEGHDRQLNLRLA